MLSFAERKKCFDYPVQAKDVKVGCTCRRGRPRLTAAALEYQYNEYVEECVYSDTESEPEQPKQKPVKRKKNALRNDSDTDEYDVFAETFIPSTSIQSTQPMVVSQTLTQYTQKLNQVYKCSPKPVLIKSTAKSIAIKSTTIPAVVEQVCRVTRSAKRAKINL